MDDLFLKIIKGEIPSAKIYEDENAFAFLDIRPINKGHALVIPKKPYRNVLDATDDDFAALSRVVRKVAKAVKESTGADGINLIMNNEAAAGQEIFHAHMHVVPRFVDDSAFQKPAHVSYENDEERFALANKIAARLSE